MSQQRRDPQSRSSWTARLDRAIRAAVASLRHDPWPAAAVLLSVFALLTATFVFPDTAAGALAAVALIAGVGAAAATATDRRWPRWLGVTIAHGIILYLAWRLFGDLWRDGIGWNRRDWGPMHARVADLVRALERGGEPGWVHGVSTGDAPYELYPSLITHVCAWWAIVADSTDDLPFILTRMAILVHVVTAIAGVRLSLRFGPWPVAALVGAVVLFERGLHSGGANSLFHWGLLHSSAATALWLMALVAVVDAIRRPRLWSSVQIWCFAGLAVAAHPLGLVACGLTAIALLLVAVLARDVPARRPLAAAFHVALAVMLAAGVWMPLTARLLEFATAYPTVPAPHVVFLEELLRGDWPPSTFAALMGAGLAGALIGLLSRRAQPTLIGALVAGAAIGFSDQIYTALDLGATPELARFSHMRLMWLARVPILVGIAIVARLALDRGAGHRRTRAMTGALVAVLAVWGLRGVLPLADRAAEKVRDEADVRVAEPQGLRELARWATARASEARPDRFGRLMFESPANYVYHVHAISGLPTLWVGAVSGYLLRERISAPSPAELRRFNVRWVVEAGKSPQRGDPKTEVVVGGYHIRERKAWDGRFARIERGDGEVRTLRLDDEAVTVELTGTDRPALVALGTGYYPRWRARSGDRALPVYALPSAQGSDLSVVAAWIPPGITTFTADGPLPSDGRGRWLARLAALLALAITVSWTVPRLRRRALRRMARAHLRLTAAWRLYRRRALLLGVPAAAVLITAAAALGARGPASAVGVGNGVRGVARVDARRHGERWRRCEYHRVRGTYRCAGLLEVGDALGQVLQPPKPSWRLVTPVIRIRRDLAAGTDQIEFRIRVKPELDGAYRAGVRDGSSTVVIDDRPAKDLGSERVFELAPGRHRLTFEGRMARPFADIAFVAGDAVEPERDYPRPPARAPF